MSRYALRCHDLTLSYYDKPVLNKVTFDLETSELGLLLGPVGSGKTSLLNAIARLVDVQDGSVQVRTSDGEPTNVVPDKRHVAIAPADIRLWAHLTCEENIRFCEASTATTDLIIQRLGLENLLPKRPDQVSGGQKRLVSVARALATPAPLVLLDEPFANLGEKESDQLMELLHDDVKTGRSILVTAHYPGVNFGDFDKMGVIFDGYIRQWDTPKTLVNSPLHQAVVRELQLGDLICVTARTGFVETIFGPVPITESVVVDKSYLALFPRGSLTAQPHISSQSNGANTREVLSELTGEMTDEMTGEVVGFEIHPHFPKQSYLKIRVTLPEAKQTITAGLQSDLDFQVQRGNQMIISYNKKEPLRVFPLQE